MRSGAGEEPAWRVGEARTISGPVSIGSHGYHASRTWLDALAYAPGPIACIVEVSCPAHEALTQLVARTRVLVDCRDASSVVGVFACECMARALRKAGVEDWRPRAAIEARRRWIEGEVDETMLRAARVVGHEASKSTPVGSLLRAVTYVVDSENPAVAARLAVRFALATADLDELCWQKRRLASLLLNLFATEERPSWAGQLTGEDETGTPGNRAAGQRSTVPYSRTGEEKGGNQAQTY